MSGVCSGSPLIKKRENKLLFSRMYLPVKEHLMI